MKFLLLIHVFLPTIYDVVGSKSDSLTISHLLDFVEKFNTVMDHQNEIKKVLDRPTPAFTVQMGEQQQTVAINETIEFSSVKINVNDCYNINGGVFKAPVSGTYYFSLTISQMQGSDTNSADIVAGKGKEILGYIHNYPSSFIEPRTVYVLAHLDADEDVWIRCAQTECDYRPGGYSAFSGFLVQEI